jgi:muramoyltetrapeptide carboxypeptidase LdcA involved in peptidoglycan recycling
MNCKRPARLQRGDTVAIVSPSWGGPSIFPHVYDKGLDTLRAWGLRIREYPSARASNDFLYRNPRARAQDINEAFADQAIKAIFASIGGDDSVRLLPYLDPETIAGNPKIITGYSDTRRFLPMAISWGS